MVPDGRNSGRFGGPRVKIPDPARKLSFEADLSKNWILVTVVGIALVMSFSWSLRGPLPTWGDETFTLRLATSDWENFREEIKLDVHPPLYFALNKIFSGDAGAEGIKAPANVRSLSYVIYMLLLWLIFTLLRSRVGRIVDIFYPMALIVSSAHLALFCPMMRYYGLAGLGITCATLLLLPETGYPPSFSRKPILPAHVWYGITLITAFASSYLTFAVLPAHLIYLRTRPDSEAKPFRQALGIVLMFSLPLIWLLMVQMGSRTGFTNPGFSGLIIGAIARIAFSVYSFLLGESFRPWDWIYIIPALPAFLYLLIHAWNARVTQIGSLLWIILATGLLLGGIVLAWTDVGIEFSASRLLFLAPIFLILLGLGASAQTVSTRQRVIKIICLAVLVILNLTSTAFFGTRTSAIQSTYIIPWGEITADISEEMIDDTLLIYDDDTLLYYIDEQPSFALNANTIGNDLDYHAGILPGYERVIVVYSPRDITAAGVMSGILDTLDQFYTQADSIEYIREDEQSIRFKSILLRRQIEPVKKALRIYDAAG